MSKMVLNVPPMPQMYTTPTPAPTPTPVPSPIGTAPGAKANHRLYQMGRLHKVPFQAKVDYAHFTRIPDNDGGEIHPAKIALLDLQSEYAQRLNVRQGETRIIEANNIQPHMFTTQIQSSQVHGAIQASTAAGLYFDKPLADTDAYRVHVDFANAKLGGGWASRGMVQEEVAVLENKGFAEACLYAHEQFLDNSGGGIGESSARGLLVENTKRVGAFIPEAYGSKGRQMLTDIMKRKLNPRDIFKPLQGAQTINWAAIVAPPISNTAEVQFAEGTFKRLVRHAYTGFLNAKTRADQLGKPLEINTGAWGCGAYNNDKTVSMFAQFTAAKLAGVDSITFHDMPQAMLDKCEVAYAKFAANQPKDTYANIDELAAAMHEQFAQLGIK